MMNMRMRFRFLSAFFVVVSLTSFSGCNPPKPSVQALFTRHELLSRGRLAVIGLTPEQEQIFMASYVRTFPLPIVTFVERYQLEKILNEQDLLKGRLDDNTRAKIKRILGVEALIICKYYDDDTVEGKKLRIRIVDSETGMILGSVMTVAGDHFLNHCEMAVQALKKDLVSKEQSAKISG